MKECWDEGGLRAYFDREMPPEEMTRIAVHLGACGDCHTRYNEVAARAARVSSMMGALAPETLPLRVARSPRRRWVRPAASGALALAAAIALAFVLIPRRAVEPQPVAAPPVEHVHRPIQAEATPTEIEPPAAAHSAPARVARAKSAPRPKAVQTDYYLALDDEPIDVGVVMRVALDSAAAVQADVIFDAEGRPRAIRPVKLSTK
jgi:anti-sigma factor RsiW